MDDDTIIWVMKSGKNNESSTAWHLSFSVNVSFKRHTYIGCLAPKFI